MSKRDAEQVQKVLAGDLAAYEPLVEAYQGRIFAFVAGRIRDFSATEDIVQNTFVEAYMHLKSLKSPEKFSGWLRGIALNLSNKWIQQKRPVVSIDETSQDLTPEISEFPLPDLPDEALEKTETKEVVIAAVDALPDIYRESVLLHYMEGMTYPEIAAFLDIPESTVTGRLQVARNRLRDELMPLVEDTFRDKRPTPQLTRKIMLALRMHANGTYETAARILVDKKVRSEKTLLYAQNALKEALQKQKKWGGNGRGELICRDLLARAYQLVGQHGRAVAEAKTVILGWQTREDLGDLELAYRQASVDKAKTHLLRIYIDQKAWAEADEIAFRIA